MMATFFDQVTTPDSRVECSAIPSFEPRTSTIWAGGAPSLPTRSPASAVARRGNGRNIKTAH